MILEGFARREFVMKGRNTRKYREREWTETDHNLDFVFERDGLAYGVEVKNTLSYMDSEEFSIKMALAEHLGIVPVFAARMLPKSWMNELIDRGGYGMILKYQLYPWGHADLAKRVAKELRLPVDSPRALAREPWTGSQLAPQKAVNLTVNSHGELRNWCPVKYLARTSLNTLWLAARERLWPPNGWRVSGERGAEGDERVRCTRVLGGRRS